MTKEVAIKEETLPNMTEGQQFMAMLERLAVSPNVDPAKMQAILDVQERILNKAAEGQFNQDFMSLQKSLPKITKDGVVAYRDKDTGKMEEAFQFATYENIYKAIKPSLDEHGFALTFTTETKEGGGVIVHATLLHKGGHSQKASMPVALDTSGGKNNIQAAGSSLSYGKRYALTALLNIVTEGEDDDGNAADLIDEKQFKKLKKLIDDTETEEKEFLAYYGIDALDQLKKVLFPTVENILLTKKNMQQAEKIKTLETKK